MFTLTFSMLTEGGEDTSEMQFGQIQHHTFNLIFLHELQFSQHPRQSLSFQKTLLSNCFQDCPPPTLPPRQVEIDSRGFLVSNVLAKSGVVWYLLFEESLYLQTPIVRHDHS